MNKILRFCTVFIGLALVLTSCKKEQPDKLVKTLISYDVVAAQTIVLPISEVQGIASDQTNFWILSGGYNAYEHKLTCFDPVNQTVVNQFVFDSLIEVLGTGVYGLTWDGSHIWISVCGQKNKLVQVDPQNGSILQSINAPGWLGPSDLDWDGDILWMTYGTGEIVKVDTTNGSSELFAYQSDRDHGIAVRGSQVWVGELFDGDIHIYDKTSADLIGYLPGLEVLLGTFAFTMDN